MYAKQQAIAESVTALKKAIGKGFTVTPDMIDSPPDPSLGDLAFPCFELAKGEGRNPVEIATELAAKIGPSDLIEKISSAGPYVNFWMNSKKLTELVLAEAMPKKGNYGDSILGKDRKVLVEYAQPNTHKEFHVGHIRNAVLGQSVVNILKANGYEVVAASYIGDIGAHVAKAIWGLNKFHKDEEITEEDHADKLGGIYTAATKYVEENESAKEEIAEVQRKLEDGDADLVALWKETREWSLKSFKRIFKELHVKPDVWYFESDVEAPGKELVKKLLTEGIAKKSEGATVVDLEDEDLGIFLVLKTDGSSLYATKDLALALKKESDFAPDRQIFVVDVRQSLYFKQLFATLKRMGFTEQLTHLAYDMVNLPEGTMSSRSGNIISYDDLRRNMEDVLHEETAKRHDDWDEKKIEKTAKGITGAAITFMMLRQDPNSIITFDTEEAMSVDGFTGPYILYTISRIESIRKKTKIKPKLDADLLTHENEQELVRALAEFPEVVQRAGKTFTVSAVAQWAFDTAKLFAEYYHEVHVIEEDDKEGTAARLALIEAVQKTLIRALELLAIEPIKEM
jgi:arginyl-tRNA synthetase